MLVSLFASRTAEVLTLHLGREADVTLQTFVNPAKGGGVHQQGTLSRLVCGIPPIRCDVTVT